MPIYETTIKSLYGKREGKVELTGVNLPDFTTINILSLKELKNKFQHTRDKTFFIQQMTSSQYTKYWEIMHSVR